MRQLTAVILALAVSAAALAIDRLPTGERLDPAGRGISVGNFPLSMAMAPDHKHVVMTFSGWFRQAVRVIDLETGQITQTFDKNAVFVGIAFVGDVLYVSGGQDNIVYRFTWRDGQLHEQKPITGVNFPCGVAASTDRTMLYVAENLADDLAVVDLATSTVVQRLPTDHYPYRIAVGGDRVYVSAWGGYTISTFRAVERGRLAPTGRVMVGRHPSAVLVNGLRLYAALASVDQVAVVDTFHKKVVRRLIDKSPMGPLEGSTPDALALAGDRLYVAEADNNAVAVFSTKNGELLGRIPVDWYPVSLLVDDNRLLVLCAKGAGSVPNPDGPRPGGGPTLQYDLAQVRGTLRVINISHLDLEDMTRRVAYANNWTIEPGTHRYPPFKHVVYVIKENRTYDQVLGDMLQGDGDPGLVFFGRDVTPNEHALAERFGLFDRFLVNAEVSSQGHLWADAAYVTDYTEKTVQSVYAHKRPDIDEGEVDEPANGFLWDNALKNGISYRVYGEYAMPVESTAHYRSRKRVSAADINPDYPSFDLQISDQHRADIWIAELQEFVKTGEMPALEIVQLPRDHTAAGKAGYCTPRACVADNDLALGRMVEALSKTPYWQDTAMFVLEDDAQDGSDHIDSHRAPFFVISAYNRPGAQHRFANTTDTVATIEQILGLDPLSQYDFYGHPLYDVFAETPDLTPFKAVPAGVPLDEKNPPNTPAAKKSAKFDVSKPDAVDGKTFNKVLREMLNKAVGASK